MYRLIVSCFLLILATNISAEELKPINDDNLTYILNNLNEFSEVKEFNNDFQVRIFSVSNYSHCAVAFDCRALKKLYIATSELDLEGPVMNLYELPPKHEWHIVKWEKLDKGKQGLYLRAETYSSNKPDASKKEENYLLKLDYISAELNTL